MKVQISALAGGSVGGSTVPYTKWLPLYPSYTYLGRGFHPWGGHVQEASD